MEPRTDRPIIVPERHSGERLDAFLAAFLRKIDGDSAPSRAWIREDMARGLVSVNGEAASDPRRRLLRGESISYAPSERRTDLVPAPELPIRILHEDDRMIVIDKPAGIATHPVSFEETGTVANWAAAHVPAIASVGDDPVRPGIVHRLDRNTSGILVLAKTDATFAELKRAFSERLTEKRYSALVLGHVPSPSGEISLPIASRTGTLRRYAVREGDPVPDGAREALTAYTVRTRYPEGDLLDVFPKTGRTHQIRVHLSAIGHPVLGDRLYGGRRVTGDGHPDRQLLHAGTLAFPLGGKTYRFESPLPSDFEDFLSALDGMEKAGYPGKALND